MTGALIKRDLETDMHTGRRPHEHWCYMPRYYQKLGERPWTNPSLVPSEGIWPCQYLNCRLLPPRTTRQWISIVLSPLGFGILSQQLQESNTTLLLKRLFPWIGWRKVAVALESLVQLMYVYSTRVAMMKLIESLEKWMYFVSGSQQCFPWFYTNDHSWKNGYEL